MTIRNEKNVSLTLKVSPSFKARLEAFCTRQGLVMSRFIEDAVAREIDDREDLMAASYAAEGDDLDFDAYLAEKGFRLVPVGPQGRGPKGAR